MDDQTFTSYYDAIVSSIHQMEGALIKAYRSHLTLFSFRSKQSSVKPIGIPATATKQWLDIVETAPSGFPDTKVFLLACGDALAEALTKFYHETTNMIKETNPLQTDSTQILEPSVDIDATPYLSFYRRTRISNELLRPSPRYPDIQLSLEHKLLSLPREINYVLRFRFSIPWIEQKQLQIVHRSYVDLISSLEYGIDVLHLRQSLLINIPHHAEESLSAICELFEEQLSEFCQSVVGSSHSKQHFLLRYETSIAIIIKLYDAINRSCLECDSLLLKLARTQLKSPISKQDRRRNGIFEPIQNLVHKIRTTSYRIEAILFETVDHYVHAFLQLSSTDYLSPNRSQKLFTASHVSFEIIKSSTSQFIGNYQTLFNAVAHHLLLSALRILEAFGNQCVSTTRFSTVHYESTLVQNVDFRNRTFILETPTETYIQWAKAQVATCISALQSIIQWDQDYISHTWHFLDVASPSAHSNKRSLWDFLSNSRPILKQILQSIVSFNLMGYLNPSVRRRFRIFAAFFETTPEAMKNALSSISNVSSIQQDLPPFCFPSSYETQTNTTAKTAHLSGFSRSEIILSEIAHPSLIYRPLPTVLLPDPTSPTILFLPDEHPYPCTLCSDSFVSVISLTNHIHLHHPERHSRQKHALFSAQLSYLSRSIQRFFQWHGILSKVFDVFQPVTNQPDSVGQLHSPSQPKVKTSPDPFFMSALVQLFSSVTLGQLTLNFSTLFLPTVLQRVEEWLNTYIASYEDLLLDHLTSIYEPLTTLQTDLLAVINATATSQMSSLPRTSEHTLQEQKQLTVTAQQLTYQSETLADFTRILSIFQRYEQRPLNSEDNIGDLQNEIAFLESFQSPRLADIHRLNSNVLSLNQFFYAMSQSYSYSIQQKTNTIANQLYQSRGILSLGADVLLATIDNRLTEFLCSDSSSLTLVKLKLEVTIIFETQLEVKVEQLKNLNLEEQRLRSPHMSTQAFLSHSESGCTFDSSLNQNELDPWDSDLHHHRKLQSMLSRFQTVTREYGIEKQIEELTRQWTTDFSLSIEEAVPPLIIGQQLLQENQTLAEIYSEEIKYLQHNQNGDDHLSKERKIPNISVTSLRKIIIEANQSLSHIDTLATSPYATSFSEHLQQLKATISRLPESLTILQETQDRCVKLFALFTSSFILTTLPSQGRQFDSILLDWMRILEQIQNKPFPFYLFQPGTYVSLLLPEIAKQTIDCLESLDPFFQQQKSMFPPLYMLSNDQLVLMLAHSIQSKDTEIPYSTFDLAQIDDSGQLQNVKVGRFDDNDRSGINTQRRSGALFDSQSTSPTDFGKINNGHVSKDPKSGFKGNDIHISNTTSLPHIISNPAYRRQRFEKGLLL
ncbi:putative Dynein heavy chain, N-terminal region 2 [Blattamonas nauphoetae]|uniref:Dynein heavy chain, N-terminal region 2 n=1 Tax=Blattamonas nauphoetae TaxID=2049346 RepID=A0ABQ9Y1L7_9EUKA|nr:putative Dynein heavy chain, N-terminal region 2 [Blattamonas nauphoetae]